MQLRKFLGIVMLSSISALSVGAAHAEGLTRAQVRQQLIEAQQDGSTASGIAGTAAAMPVQTGSPAPKDNCVGPVSFCNLYSGG